MNLKYFYTVSLGLFIAIGLTVMGRMTLYLRTSYAKETHEIQVLFNNIDRIRIGTRVSYAGKTIGEIIRVEFPDNYRDIYINDELYPFKVTFNIDKQIPLFNTDIIKPVTSGLMGEKNDYNITPQHFRVERNRLQQPRFYNKTGTWYQ